MSVHVIAWAFDQDLPSNEKFLLVALANYANDDGECYPGQASLAKRVGTTDRAVRENLRRLEDRGLIERSPRMLREGRGRTSDLCRIAYRHDQPEESSGYSQDDQPEANARPTGSLRPTNRKPTSREPLENRQRDTSEKQKKQLNHLSRIKLKKLAHQQPPRYPRS